MRAHTAFMLAELLIALSISSFIIFSMMQSQRTVMRFVDRTSTTMQINRRVTLMFDQMERDISACFIPTLSPIQKMPAQGLLDPRSGNDANDRQKQTAEQPPALAEKKKKKDKKWFFATADENEVERVDGVKRLLCKEVSCITTNCMQIFGERGVHLVRVRYQLVPRKGETSQRTSYDLIRFETTDLENVACIPPEEDNDKKKRVHTYRRHIIARHIKHMALQCEMPDPRKKKTNQSDQEEQHMIVRFDWGGDDKKTRDVVPQKVTIHVTLWEENTDNTHSFSCMVPVILFVPAQSSSSDDSAARSADAQPRDDMQATDDASRIPRSIL